MPVYQGDSWKSVEESKEPEQSRHQRQVDTDNDFLYGRIDHHEWNRRTDHLSDPENWRKPFLK